MKYPDYFLPTWVGYKEIPMKTITALLFAVLLVAPLAWAEVGPDDLNRVRMLVEAKKYPEALEGYQHFFEASRGASGMGGVRLSYVLFEWADLGRIYPPASEALRELAAQRRDEVLTGDGHFGRFHEYTAINRALNDEQETIDAFLALEQKSPEAAKGLYALVSNLLLEHDRLDVVGRYHNDPIYDYENLRHRREYALSQLRKKELHYSLREINREFDKGVKELIAKTLKMKMKTEADEIRRRATAYRKDSV